MEYNEEEIQRLVDYIIENQSLSQCKEMLEAYDRDSATSALRIRMYCNLLGLEPNERESCIKLIKIMHDDVFQYEYNLKYVYAYERAIQILETKEEEDSE